MIKDAEITLIVGKRGSGKSTKAKDIIKDCSRLVVYDILKEYHKSGCVIVSSIKDLLIAIKKGWQNGFKIAFQPNDEDEHVSNVSEILDYLKKVQVNYFNEKDDRKITFLIEEAHFCIPNRQSPEVRPILSMINVGRHFGIEMIAITQRISEIHTTFRANVTKIYIFGIAGATEFDTVSRITGKEWAEKLQQVPVHCGIFYNNGEITAIKNKLL